MDNLTHTLIGFIAGESVARVTPTGATGLSSDLRRRLFVTLAAIGGNLPDLDLIYSYRGAHDSQGKLDYMLQHRGYTHTVVGCLVLIALLYAGAEWWLRRRQLALTRGDRWALAGVCMFGTLLHLGMDFLNSYGVHPFWPIQNRWVYGDSVFIVEPLYWAAAAPLIFVAVSVPVRVIIALALVAGPALGFFLGLVPIGPLIGYGALTLALLLVGARASANVATLASALAMIGVTATFVIAGRAAAHSVDRAAAMNFPGERRVDHVLTPAPMNPLCWNLLLLETQGDRYIVRRGVVSDAPGLIPAARCSVIDSGRLMGSSFGKSAAPQAPDLYWLGELAMSKAWLAKVVTEHCDAAALMLFARVPFAEALENRLVMSDLRFDQGRGNGMSSLSLGAPTTEPCLPPVPWTQPRLDLLP
jgi:inner membrane protein